MHLYIPTSFRNLSEISSYSRSTTERSYSRSTTEKYGQKVHRQALQCSRMISRYRFSEKQTRKAPNTLQQMPFQNLAMYCREMMV